MKRNRHEAFLTPVTAQSSAVGQSAQIAASGIQAENSGGRGAGIPPVGGSLPVLFPELSIPRQILHTGIPVTAAG